MHQVTLQKGLTVGDKQHLNAVLRPLSAGDIIAAMEESERVIMAPNAEGKYEPALLLSNALMGVNTLRRQVAMLGDIQGPLEVEQFKLLSDIDLDLLQKGVTAMDMATAKAIVERGRDVATGSDD
ncbi:phage tail assembly protein [Marinomonas transparens]|uniref:Phage tail assembly protein n=1 Tax=Marinomonas transparens TaxID=2795388 RepID=A0A934JMJ5_9GAMM|nr:phage tail assembly protein [Marinomonas transparens]MBJ7537163.1 phage tail assembly protein [Marinomonas transparens]